MNVNLNGARMPQSITSRSGKIPEGATVISPNIKKQSVYVDKDGNHYDSLDPKTRKLIKKANPND